MLVLVFFNEHSNYIHERGERVIFVFAYFVGQVIEKLDQLFIFALRAGDADRA